MTDTPSVTIVVVPRDHFCDTQESLESLYAHTEIPFSLVYVDGGSPPRVKEYLEHEAAARGFRLIRTEYYLSPNHARNIGARDVATRYIVFVDNDVVAAPNWLAPLVECAAKTGAAIVSPLTFERRPVHTILHFAGGRASIDTKTTQAGVERHMIDLIFSERAPPSREITECAEFHAVLVRTESFRKVGGLDERFLSSRENIDFCMVIREAGGTIYMEPGSKITYLPPEQLRLSDLPFFVLRWSDAWDRTSFHWLRDKWTLVEDAYFAREYRNLGWRRRDIMIRDTFLRWIPSWRVRRASARALMPVERWINRLVSETYARRHGLPGQ
jgi:GT2 family glycosyltransferase